MANCALLSHKGRGCLQEVQPDSVQWVQRFLPQTTHVSSRAFPVVLQLASTHVALLVSCFLLLADIESPLRAFDSHPYNVCLLADLIQTLKPSQASSTERVRIVYLARGRPRSESSVSFVGLADARKYVSQGCVIGMCIRFWHKTGFQGGAKNVMKDRGFRTAW